MPTERLLGIGLPVPREGGMTPIGALETLAAGSPAAAAAVMRRDGSTSVAPALLAGAGSTDGVAPEATVLFAAGSAIAPMPWRWRRGVAAIDEITRCVRRSVLT